MKYVVSGGAGFLGTNLILRLMKDHEVIMLDHRPEKSVLLDNPDVRVVKMDVVDREPLMELFREFKPDCVFHLAGHINVRKSIENPVLDAKVNIEGTLNVLDACKEVDSRMVFTSSCAVYGTPKVLPNHEEHTLHPISPYGISKLTAESYVSMYAKLFNLKTISLRLSNVYGTWNRKGAIHIFIESMLKDENINIFGNGEQRRDLVFVDDVVDALLKASEDNHYGQVFNIATGKSTSVNKMVKIIAEAVKNANGKSHEAHLNYTSAIKGEIKNSYASIVRARDYLKWKPKTSFEDGIKKTVEWMVNR